MEFSAVELQKLLVVLSFSCNKHINVNINFKKYLSEITLKGYLSLIGQTPSLNPFSDFKGPEAIETEP